MTIAFWPRVDSGVASSKFGRLKIWGGLKCLALSEQQYFCLDAASQSTKLLDMLKIGGTGHGSLATPMIVDCLSRSLRGLLRVK